MGVDGRGGDYQVEVTVSTGKRAYGLQGESQPSLVLSAQRESLSAACLAMQGLSDSYVFYGYVDQLLLGEGLIKRSVWPVLDYFAQDAQLGLGVQLWVVRGGTAAQAVQAGGESGVENRLSTLQTDSEMGAAGASRTAGRCSLTCWSGAAPICPLSASRRPTRRGRPPCWRPGTPC